MLYNYISVPGPPINVYFPQVNDSSATIVWETPAEQNGIIQEYKVVWRLKDSVSSPDDKNYADKDKNTFEHSVSGLLREKYYVFLVSARTELGWGEAAEVEVYTTTNRGIRHRILSHGISL